MSSEPFTLLVADDNPENLRVLSTILAPEGYNVRVAPDGRRALSSMEARTPDLLLLDIHMPELDGYGTFQKMRESKALCTIPVIFLTALSEAFHKVKAFEMGAADYICKPFEPQEVLARVSAQLRLLAMRRDLQERNQNLQEVNAKLEELEQFRQLFSQMAVHDMRSPLMASLGALELLHDEGVVPDDSADLLRGAIAATRQASMLVDGLLDIARAQAGSLELRREHHNLAGLIKRALEVLEGLTVDRVVRPHMPAQLPDVCCDAAIIERVIINLLDNALKHTPPPDPVDLGVEADTDAVRIRVSDRGPGIPVDERERIFDTFTRLDRTPSRRPSTGLGLAFCKLALDAHDQAVHVEDRAGGGAVFWFELPTTAACAHKAPVH